MQPEKGTGAKHGFAAHALLWLELLTLAVGVLQFSMVPLSVLQPGVAIAALLLLPMCVLLARTVPALRRSSTRSLGVEVGALLLCITLLVLATGATASALITLYVVPLVAVALISGRWWLVLLHATIIVAVCVALGAMTDVDVATSGFAMQLLAILAPASAVALVISLLIQQMQGAVQRINDLASADSLTGLLNARAFDEILQQEHRKAERFGRPYTLLVVDVDNLAQANEMMGHEAGNQIIVAVAAAIDRSIRNSDVEARFGGDSFIVLLTEADAATGTAIGQRIRNNVYSSTVSVANRLVRANVSVGMATFPEDHLYPKELMILADQRMQQDRELRRPVKEG